MCQLESPSLPTSSSLKANLLAAAEPEEAITTHPAVTAAAGKMAKAAGAAPVIADSPGSGFQYTEGTLKRDYRTCGMYDAAAEAGIDVNLDTTYQAISFPEGVLAKRLDVITPVVKADGVFNLCKLKTHTYMGMTGAVKNHFGIIPGLAKPGYHAKLHDTDRFADMLLDLAAYVAPRVSIMDAVLRSVTMVAGGIRFRTFEARSRSLRLIPLIQNMRSSILEA